MLQHFNISIKYQFEYHFWAVQRTGRHFVVTKSTSLLHIFVDLNIEKGRSRYGRKGHDSSEKRSIYSRVFCNSLMLCNSTCSTALPRIYALVTRGAGGATLLNRSLQRKSINFGTTANVVKDQCGTSTLVLQVPSPGTRWWFGGRAAPEVGKVWRWRLGANRPMSHTPP